MVKKLVKSDERVVFFFGKRRKLDENGGFKIGRMYVHTYPQLAPWCAALVGYNEEVTVSVRNARSRAAALKQLERRIESLQRALDTFCREAW